MTGCRLRGGVTMIGKSGLTGQDLKDQDLKDQGWQGVMQNTVKKSADEQSGAPRDAPQRPAGAPSGAAPGGSYSEFESRGLSPEKAERLERFLEALPIGAVERLFAVIDLDRVRSAMGSANPSGANPSGEGQTAPTAKTLPHADLLDLLRGILVERGGRFPERAPTAQRIFFTPFEDFLTLARRNRKRRARIPRWAIAPIWRMLMSDPACAAARACASALDAALADGADNDEIARLEKALFENAHQGFSTLLDEAHADDASYEDLQRRLRVTGTALTPEREQRRDPALMDDLIEITLILPLVARLRDVQRLLPKPVSALTEEELFEVRRIYLKAREDAPHEAIYILLCVASRMEKPWRAVRLYSHFVYHQTGLPDSGLADRGGVDEDIDAAFADDDDLSTDNRRPDRVTGDAQILLEILFEDLEGMARVLERDAAEAFDPDDARLRLDYFADYAGGMVDEGHRACDGALVSRAEASRDLALEALYRYCEQAVAMVREAQPVRRTSGSVRLVSMRPDIQYTLHEDSVTLSRKAAYFIAGTPDIARALGRPTDQVAAFIDEAREGLDRYARDLIIEIRAAEGEDRARARARMDVILSLASALLAPGAIAVLKEKAAAAALSA